LRFAVQRCLRIAHRWATVELFSLPVAPDETVELCARLQCLVEAVHSSAKMLILAPGSRGLGIEDEVC
jgi:hypothetical protein